MHGVVTIIKPDSSIEVHHFSDVINLNQWQSFVEGNIEMIPNFNTYKDVRAVAFCNEEGKVRGLLPNRAATIEWYKALGFNADDVLVGNVAIVQGDTQFMEAL